jgi:hypothetical protein
LVIARLLFGLLADMVFDAAASNQRSFGAEMNRYLKQKGLARARMPREATTH